MYDLIIKNAKIIDGTGADEFKGAVGVIDGKLKFVNGDEEASQVIDAEGLYLTPGFIDAHSHGDQVLGQYPGMLAKINQGITTEIAGQCGGSMFPVTDEHIDLEKGLLAIGTLTFPDEMSEWKTAKEYFEYARKTPKIGNMKILIGHSTLRAAVMGYADRKPTAEEMAEMKRQVKIAMECGAAGLSSGLIYAPGCYADIDELAELASVVKEYGGFYATHMRSESVGVVEAVKEAIEIGRRAGVPVWISHHKVAGRPYWGAAKETTRLIDEANASGMKVTADQYPYEANMTDLNICIPPKYFVKNGVDGMVEALKNPETRAKIREEMQDVNCGYDNFYLNAGGFDNIFIAGCPEVKEADGKFVSEYAKEVGKDPFDAYFDLLIANGGKANGIYFTMGEEDMVRIISNPNVCVGTDGTCRTLDEKTHPRTFAAFPKAIRYYHKEKQLFTLPEMIHKITGFVAERAGLEGKGVIKDGNDADLVIFDYDKLNDTPTYSDPVQMCDGIEYVIVGGKIVYHDKKTTGEYPGKIL